MLQTRVHLFKRNTCRIRCSHLQLVVVDFFVFVGVEQLEGFFDFVFLILRELLPLPALGPAGRTSFNQTYLHGFTLRHIYAADARWNLKYLSHFLYLLFRIIVIDNNLCA